MDWTIVLNKDHHALTQEGTRAESRVIHIPPGKVGLLSMFNMIEVISLVGTGANAVLSSKGCARLLKVSVAKSGNLPHLIDCAQFVDLRREHERLLEDRSIIQEPVYQCGQEWNISPCNSMMLIPVPGLYIIELFDVDQLDEAYIEFTTLTVAEAAIIPDSFKLGAQS